MKDAIYFDVLLGVADITVDVFNVMEDTEADAVVGAIGFARLNEYDLIDGRKSTRDLSVFAESDFHVIEVKRSS